MWLISRCATSGKASAGERLHCWQNDDGQNHGDGILTILPAIILPIPTRQELVSAQRLTDAERLNT
jgi:hypothetical protein